MIRDRDFIVGTVQYLLILSQYSQRDDLNPHAVSRLTSVVNRVLVAELVISVHRTRYALSMPSQPYRLYANHFVIRKGQRDAGGRGEGGDRGKRTSN